MHDAGDLGRVAGTKLRRPAAGRRVRGTNDVVGVIIAARPGFHMTVFPISAGVTGIAAIA